MIEMNQMVYCVGVGGVKNNRRRRVERLTKSTEVYDIKTDKWSQLKDLNEEIVRRPSLVSINDQYLYAIGGSRNFTVDYLLI